MEKKKANPETPTIVAAFHYNPHLKGKTLGKIRGKLGKILSGRTIEGRKGTLFFEGTKERLDYIMQGLILSPFDYAVWFAVKHGWIVQPLDSRRRMTAADRAQRGEWDLLQRYRILNLREKYWASTVKRLEAGPTTLF